MKSISKAIFSCLSLKSVATNSLLQESVQTRPCLCCIMSTEVCVDVRVCSYTYRCPCAKTHCELNTVAPPPVLPLSSSLSLCFSYITARRPRPNLHFSSFASLSVFFIPSSFLLTPLPCFSTFFCSRGGERGGGVQNMKGGRT